MITKNQLLALHLTENELIEIIAKAKRNFKIAQLDNLRHRHPNIQFDCILRGYVGEYAIVKWLGEHDIHVEAINLFVEKEGIDIDFYYKNKNIELKTSLLPDADETIANVILRRDIKLIKRENRIEDLRGDVHLQIYFSQKRKAKDDWLSQQTIDIESNDNEYLYRAFKVYAYKDTTFFTAWIDKPTLIENIKSMPQKQQTWTFSGSKRTFWSCKIQHAKAPEMLIEYLKNLADPHKVTHDT